MSQALESLMRRHRQQELAASDQELSAAIEDIAQKASDFGLRPFPTDFQMVPAHKMYELGAYGIPGRFSHWTQGAAYHKMKTMYDYGLSKIYEMVINTNPAQAFLMEGNSLIQNKLVAAHVLAHVDFFAQNESFQATNRKMTDSAQLHAERIRTYEFEHGKEEVEKFMDAALTVEWNIDTTDFQKPPAQEYIAENRRKFEMEQKQAQNPQRKSDYHDLWELGEKKADTGPKQKVPFPCKEEQDLLWFIANFSPKPLEEWQVDIIDIVRNEVQYFAPQAKTKIMNEGWATLWHGRILRELGDLGKLKPGEDIEWAQLNSGVAAPSRTGINPYYVGWKMWEDIERKYNGLPHSLGKKEKNWRGDELPPEYFKGREEYDIFRVREQTPTDEAFIRNHLTDTLIRDLDLYVYARDEGGDWVITEKDPHKIRDRLIASLANFGNPVIQVAKGGGDFNGNSELYLKHAWEGADLDMSYAEKTLKALYALWGRPVHLETKVKGEQKIISCKTG